MLGGGLLATTSTGPATWLMAVGALERKFWETLAIYSLPGLKGKHIVYGEERAGKGTPCGGLRLAPARMVGGLRPRDCCVSPILPSTRPGQRAAPRPEDDRTDDGHAAPSAEIQRVRVGSDARTGPGEHTEEILRERAIARRDAALRGDGVI